MSEPPSEIIRFDPLSGALHQAEMEENGVEFFLVLCHDVFLEVIRWGNRRQLVKLECVGKKFHWNVERWFSETPFLRLDLFLAPSQTGHGLEAKVAKNVKYINEYFDFSIISLTELEAFPPFPFLRFNLIKLVGSYSDREHAKDLKVWDTQSTEAKCQLLEEQLKLIKPEILNDSILFFGGQVDRNNSSRFADHSDFLNYLHYRLLPICDKPRGYDLDVILYSDGSAAKCVLTSLLQMPQINCCSNVRIEIFNADKIKFPVHEISNWLHRMRSGQHDRFLHICLCENEGIVEIFTHLKATFEEAKFPVQPYTLTLEPIWSDEGLNQMEEQTITNEITNEQFSVEKVESNEFMAAGCFTITIKRAMKKKKN